MAKTPEKVKTFITDLGVKMKPLFIKEKEELEVYKKKNDPDSNGKLNAWDGAFYRNL
jgi:Zn-dependent oligopeptidase